MQGPVGPSTTARLWQHGRVSRPAVVLAILVVASATPACRQAVQELAGGPAGKDGPRALAEALADRFGPIEREPAFDALRPKLAHASLVPSRVFDDASAWTSRGEGWRAVELAGYASGGAYHIGVRGEAPPPEAPGQYRGRVRLAEVDGGRFEWSVEEDLAVGHVRPADLAAALDAAFRAAEGSSEAAARAAIAAGLPRASAKVGLLLHLESVALQRDSHGATSVRLAVRLTPAGIRGFDPRYAAFLEKYATPVRTSVVLSDPGGAAWWRLEAADNLWSVRLRVRDGSLVPLDGPADRRLPSRLRATGDFATRMGRFGVGAKRIAADVDLTRTAGEKAVSARFHEEPEWAMPFLADVFLGGPLSYPFEEPGSEVGWGTREAPGGRTLLVGRYRARVRETWILRWLGGLTNNAVGEFRLGAEREADQYVRECLLALRDDLADLAP
jgi:hypothetical protein